MRSLVSESSIQCNYLKWLNLKYPDVFKVTSSFPNGGVREPRYGARLKREGMKKGFPDLGIFIRVVSIMECLLNSKMKKED